MTSPNMNFISYNSTGMNDMKAKWISDLLVTTGASFLGVQEHFKTINLEKSFDNWFPEYKHCSKPGHREPGQDSGRAKGGLLQLIHKNVQIKVEPVKCENFRVQAQLLHFTSMTLLWMNVYLPTDNQNILVDPLELIEVLAALENIMDNIKFTDVIIQGDLNWDNSRQTAHSTYMQNFTERIGLKSVWDKYPVNFTHIHTDLKSTSTLDYFLVNESLLDSIVDAGVMHFGDNFSRHSPVILKLNLAHLQCRQPQENISLGCRPTWYKASDEDIDNFASLVHNDLDQIDIPDSLSCNDVYCSNPKHKLERDWHMLEVLFTLIESSYKAIPVSRSVNKAKKIKELPGWSEYVEPLRSDARFWYSIWLGLGKPNRGQIYNVMCWTRNKFHYAVRRLKKWKANNQAEMLLEASEKGDVELMAAMKLIKGRNNSIQKMPDCVDGETDPNMILCKFKEVYELLYNSAGSSTAMTELKLKLHDTLSVADSLFEVNKVTSKVVREAALRMKAGKRDVSGNFQSEVFLHGPPLLFDHLAALFRSFLIHGDVTEQLLSCAFLPLFKGGLKDKTKTDSYRAIAGSSLLLKLFDNVILLLWGHLLSSDSLQFGFKCGTSTTQCTWLVREVVDYYQSRGTPIIGVTLDCSKAFDVCRFDKLFEKLILRSVPPVVVRALIHIYEEQTGFVQICNKKSDQFAISNGTRQGSVLSPSLFSVYLDDLLGELRHLGMGCHIGGWWYGAVCYADDLMLLAPSRTAAALMLKCCEKYALDHNLKFSTDPVPAKSKSKCIFFCGKLTKIRKPDPLSLFGKELPWVSQADHLGHILHQSCSMDQDAVVKRARFIEKSLAVREAFHFAYPQQVLKAIQVYACDAYGAMLYDLSSKTAESLFKAWSTCVRLVWDVPRTTHTYLVENVLADNFVPLRIQIYGRYASFFRQLFVSASKEVRHLARIASRDCRSVTWRNVQLITAVCGYSPWDYSANKIKKHIPLVKVPTEDWWRPGFLRKLLECRFYKRTKQVDDMIESLCSS